MFPDAKLFCDIVAQRSISRGARLNRISQSAASQQIQELERRLNVRLLDRRTRPVNLTTAGSLYAELCRDILKREEEFTASIEGVRPGISGRIRIASIYSVGLTEVPRHRDAFRERHPHVEVVLELCRPDAVYSALLDDRVDFGLVSYPEGGRELTVLPWREEPMCVAAPLTHELAARSVVAAEDLNGLPFLAFDEDLAIRRHIDRYLIDHGAAVTVSIQVDNIETLKVCLAKGTEISILPACAVQAEVAQRQLVAIPLRDPLVRPVGIVYRKRKALSEAARLFLAALLPGDVPPS